MNSGSEVLGIQVPSLTPPFFPLKNLYFQRGVSSQMINRLFRLIRSRMGLTSPNGRKYISN